MAIKDKVDTLSLSNLSNYMLLIFTNISEILNNKCNVTVINYSEIRNSNSYCCFAMTYCRNLNPTFFKKLPMGILILRRDLIRRALSNLTFLRTSPLLQAFLTSPRRPDKEIFYVISKVDRWEENISREPRKGGD